MVALDAISARNFYSNLLVDLAFGIAARWGGERLLVASIQCNGRVCFEFEIAD
jgi:hypothetical protein